MVINLDQINNYIANRNRRRLKIFEDVNKLMLESYPYPSACERIYSALVAASNSTYDDLTKKNFTMLNSRFRLLHKQYSHLSNYDVFMKMGKIAEKEGH